MGVKKDNHPVLDEDSVETNALERRCVVTKRVDEKRKGGGRRLGREGCS